MAADLGLVVHAAQADPDEFAVHGPRDGLAKRGLADAGRADEAEDRRLALGRQLAHGKIFDDPPLDLVEPVMVLVENAARFGEIDRLLRRQGPGQLDQPIEIIADHAIFGRRLGHPLQAAQFATRLVVHLLGHLGLGDRFAQLGDLGLLVVGLAQLALDRRHLLAEQHLALALVERGPRLLADLLRQPQDFDALREKARHPIEPGGQLDGLEDLLLLLGRQIEVGADHVGEPAGIGHVADGLDQFRRRLRQELQRLERLPLEIEEAGFDLRRPGRGLLEPFDAGDQERPAAEEFDYAEPLLPLGDDVVRSILAGDVAHDIGDRADAIEIDLGRIGDLRIALRENADLTLGANGLLRRGDRARPAKRDREDRAREQDEVADRNDDQRIGGNLGGGARRATLVLCRAQQSGMIGHIPLPSGTLVKANEETAIDHLPAQRVIAPRRQGDAALKPAVRQFHAVDLGAAELGREPPEAGNDQVAAFDRRRCALCVGAREGDEDPKLGGGLEHVDRRFPRRGAGALLQLEESPTQFFDARQHVAHVGPNPQFRFSCCHRHSPGTRILNR